MIPPFLSLKLWFNPNFFVYFFSVAESPISELSMELLLLQIILPTLLEQGQSRRWCKMVIRCWCIAVSWLLGLRSYLLGDEPIVVRLIDYRTLSFKPPNCSNKRTVHVHVLCNTVCIRLYPFF